MTFMVALVLAASLALSVANQSQGVGRPQQPLRFTPGLSYLYDYEARLMTGLPQLQSQYSGFELRSQIIIQALSDSVIAMKMTSIRVGKHNGVVQQDFPSGQSPFIDHQTHAQFQQQLSKPIRFVYSEGKVKAFEADQSEPEWSLNMKKAFLSLLNVDLQPKKIIRAPYGGVEKNLLFQNSLQDLTVYPIYEEGIGGLCETVYELHNSIDPQQYGGRYPQEEAFLLNVTKTRNYDNCLSEPIIVNDNYDVRGCPWVCRKEKSFSAVPGYFPVPDAVTDPYMSGCPCGKEPNESPVNSYAFQKYNISLVGGVPLIEGVYAEGKTSYVNNGDEVLVITQQNLTLSGQFSGQSLQQQINQQIQRPKRHNELSFRLPKAPLSQTPLKTPLDIPYYYLFGPIDQQELQNLIPELIESLANQIAVEEIATPQSEKIGQNVVQMVNAMAVLQQHQLEQLFEQVAQDGASIRASPKEQVMRKLFLDALPLSGSNDAALAIKQLILSSKVTTNEAKELVEAVPQNLFLADTETIDAYLELFQSPKVQSRRHLAASVGIAFGKMVKESCVKRQATPGDIPDQQGGVPHNKRNLPAQMVVQGATPTTQRVTVTQRSGTFSQRMRRSVEWEEQFTQDVCSQSDVTKYVTIVERLLQEANAFHKKVVLIETLAHMGVPQALPVLEPYISGSAQQSGQCPGYATETEAELSEECQFIRQIAIYALSHISDNYPKQVAPLVAAVYGDRSEPYEVRIAAFTMLLFADPEKQVLERIASQLYYENNRQIKSFVYSSLQTVANITAPCYQHVSQHAQQAVQHAPQAEYGYQYSKMIGKGFYDEKKDFGLYSLVEWTSSNYSRVPRAGYLSVGQSAGPFQDEFIQIGFQAKGVDQLLERAFGQNGVFEDAFVGMRAKARDRRVNKRSADSAQQLLEALKSKLNLITRSEENPKTTIFFKLFDRTSYYALDKHYIHQVIDEAEDSIKDIAQTLMQGQQYHYVKLVMPSQIYKVVPSELGLPVVITHRHPLIISVKIQEAKLQVEVSPKTVVPIGANITAQITPSLFYSAHTFAFAINPADRQTYGTHVQKTTHAQFPVEVSVGYSRPKNLITWSVIPKTNEGQNQEIYYQKVKSETFVAKASVSGAPDSDWLQDSQEVETMATPFQYEKQYLEEELGIGVRVKVESESAWSEEPIRSGEVYDKYGTIAALVQSWRNPGLKAREVHVQLTQDDEEPIQGYDFTLRYKWIEDSEQQIDSDDSDESSASDESDSDESDESSASKSSESNSSESNSSENENKSSKSSQSSEQSDESNENDKEQQLKKRIARRMNKVISKSQRQRRSVSENKESNESSDESSNESGSKSFSKSGSRESSQSSSSESDSSEEKKKKNPKTDKYDSRSAKSSESSSSSSESDESKSFEDQVFNYEDVMQLILGQEFKRKTIKKITKQLILKTQEVWSQNWDEDYDESSSDESQENESELIPQTISHDIAFTAVARGPRPTYYALNVLYVHTYDHRIVWLKSDGYIKAPKGVYLTVPTLYCADAVVSYPTIPNEFYFEPQMASQKARIQAHMGWGQQCQSEGGVIVKGVMEQTEDHVLEEQDFAQSSANGQTSAQVQNWYYRQCLEDRSSGQPQSYACERAIEASSYFNQLILDVKYSGVPKHVQNITRKASLALKYYLYQHLEENSLDVNNPSEQIRLVLQYSQRVPDIPLFDLEIRSPEEIQMYSRVHVPHVRPVSSLYGYERVLSNLVTNYEGSYYESECHLMSQYVRTFDNVTYQLPLSPCQYLLAKDCSANERFAVFAQQLEPEVGTKTITVVTSGSEIKLLPPQQQSVAQVVVDGHAHELTYRQPVTLIGDKNNLRVYLRATPSEANNPIIVLESDINGLKVLYDGKNAKIIVQDGQYQGKTCGLCGDNNDETEDEFLGPNECRYEEEYDFANSYALSGQHCEQTPQPRGPKRCPPSTRTIAQGQQPQPQAGEEGSQEVTVAKKRTEVTSQRGPNGESTIIRQQIREGGALSNAQRANEIQTQANAEELVRTQQQMSERQMARQEGVPVQQPVYGVNGPQSPQTQQLIQRLRTQFIERDEMICFTTKPVLTCIDGVSRAQSLRRVKADFHCLPKSTQFTQQLVQESVLGVVKQLANKRVDLRQEIDVPVTCVQIVV